MSKNIAVVTVSGRAYYLLSKELKRRGIPFLSRTRMEEVPPQVKVVISTVKESCAHVYWKCLVYNENEDPSRVVDKAVDMTQGSLEKEVLYIGVDPGKMTGIAASCEYGIVREAICPTVKASVQTIMELIETTRARKKVVRLGDGGEPHSSLILEALKTSLPVEVGLETVREERTSKNLGERSRRFSKDVLSAAVISMRQGKPVERSGRAC